MDCLTIENISVRRDSRLLLNNVSFAVKPGEVVAVLGPNGAGKTTLFRVITDEITPDTGQVTLHGKPVKSWDLTERAQIMGILPQSSSLNFSFTVHEVVLLGRSPCSSNREQNNNIVRKALERVDGWHLHNRDYTSLSGGEKQRVHLARVLVQIWDEPAYGPRVLLLDEPTSALDPAHQHLTLQTAREFAQNNVAVVIIVHDLNLASQYADRLVMLREGLLEAEGPPREVLTQELLKRLLDIDVCILSHPVNGYPVVIPA